MVRTAGLEPARPCGLEILSLLRLPFRQVRLEGWGRWKCVGPAQHEALLSWVFSMMRRGGKGWFSAGAQQLVAVLFQPRFGLPSVGG